VTPKVTLVVPDPLRDYLTTAPVYVSKSGAPVPAQPDLPSTIRRAIRATRKMRIAYQDGELRNDVRHIRTDRVVSAEVLNESFSIPKTVITKWLAEHQDD
jgi:predicted DNA-binding transcriptional regulator YafY